MKTAVLITLLLISATSMAQNYQPFHEDSPTRFVNSLNPQDDNFFFYSIDTTLYGTSIEWTQYIDKSNYLNDSADIYCPVWGGTSFYADTNWLGRRIIYDYASMELEVVNQFSEPLLFDFGLSLGDSAVFYSDINVNYYIRYDNIGSELILDSLDQVKTFSIWKYDQFGSLLSSALNGFEIKLGESYGLASFIDAKHFPNQEISVELMGHVNPNIGYYQLTYDEVYPWQAGDTLEYRGSNPGAGYSTLSHRLYVVDSRVENGNVVTINGTVESQTDLIPSSAPAFTSPFNIITPTTISFEKGTPIMLYPQGATDGYGTLHTLDSVDMCGTRTRYVYSGLWEYFCEQGDCWSGYDGNGTSKDTRVEVVAGLGIVYKRNQDYGDWMFIRTAELIYSNVNGIQCGLYVPLSLSMLSLDSKEKELLRIVDVLGREVEQLKKGELYIYQYSDGTIEKRVAAE